MGAEVAGEGHRREERWTLLQLKRGAVRGREPRRKFSELQARRPSRPCLGDIVYGVLSPSVSSDILPPPAPSLHSEFQ